MITLRPYNPQTDAARIAQLYNSANPEPVTPERVEEWERNFPRGAIRQYQVALDASGTVVGYGDCWHLPHKPEGKFMLEIVVEPVCRKQGIGARLYRSTLDYSQGIGATWLETHVRDHQPEWLRFAERRGFVIDRHMFESTLDLANLDETRCVNAVEDAHAQGIRFLSLAEVGNTTENRRRLYELNRSCALDIPGSDGTFPGFEDFSKNVFEESWFRAEGQILAVDGQRWAGLSAVGYFPANHSAYNMFTGVERDYRGRHLALALKVLANRFARSLGAVYVRTNNDSKNAPILSVNRKLGYQPQPGFFRCCKALK